MSATMARRGGRVQLEKSNMRFALNMAKMAKEGFSRAMIEKTQQVIHKPRAEVPEENMQGVVFPWHNKVKAAMERHPAKVRENQTDGCLPYRNGTARIHRLAGGAKAWVHLHHDPHHRGPEHHLGQLMTLRELKAP